MAVDRFEAQEVAERNIDGEQASTDAREVTTERQLYGDYSDTHPYGQDDDDDRTCLEYVIELEAAERAARPDPNQLTLLKG